MTEKMIKYERARSLDATLIHIVNATMLAGPDEKTVNAAVRAAADEARYFLLRKVCTACSAKLRLPTSEPDANDLLNVLLAKFNLKNDRALADLLGVKPPIISKLRHRKTGLGAGLLVRIHEATGMPVSEIKSYL